MGGLLPEGSVVDGGGGGAVVGFRVVVAAWYNASFLKHKEYQVSQGGVET